jgi:hypothetical protein
MPEAKVDRMGFSLALAAAAALVAVPAYGQSGSRLAPVPPRTPTNYSTEDGIRLLVSEFADCVISHDRKHVDSYLATPPDSAESDRLWPTIAQTGCLSIGTLTLTDAGFRGGAYGRLYKSDFGKRGPMDFSAVQAIDYGARLDPTRPQDRTNIGARRFADCVARAQPAQSRKLILSRIASRDESAAFDALQPAARECLGEGLTITFSKGALRALIGEVMYRLSRAAGPASGETRRGEA